MKLDKVLIDANSLKYLGNVLNLFKYLDVGEGFS